MPHSNDLQNKCLHLYQQAVKNVESGVFNLTDEVIKALWEGCRKQQVRLTNQYQEIEILQSRLAKPNNKLMH